MITKFYTNIVVICICCLAASGCPEETQTECQSRTIGFTDENLDQAIRDALDKPYGVLYAEDLEEITSLDLAEYGIGDLNGIQCLTSLNELYLDHLQLSDIGPLANLTSLTVLDLSSNQVSDITPLSGLVSLTELDLSSNQISDLEPLVSNPGIGAEDLVDIVQNPIDNPGQESNIDALCERGVHLHPFCPNGIEQ